MVKSAWGRRKWLAIVVFLVPFVAGASLIMFMPSLYRSTATILVDRQQVPESMVRPTVTSALETRLHTISQEILSRSRLDALIKQFNLYPTLRDLSLEEVIERMRRDIRLELRSVEQKGDNRNRATVAFALSYEGRDPVTVARVTNTLASFYIEENLKARERQAAGTADFLKAQVDEVKKRLDTQDTVLSAFKKRYMGELPQQTDANLSTVERLNGQLRMNGDSQLRLQERIESLARQMAEAAAFSPGVGGPEAREQRLARLNMELRALRASYSDKYPDILRIKHEIAELEQELAAKPARPDEDQTAATTNPQVLRLREAKAQADSELGILKNEEKRLRSALASYIGRIENAPKREQEFRELTRDYESTRETYASLLKRYEEAQMAENMEQRQKGEQFRLLDAAVPSAQPAAPNRLRLLLMALAGSVALAVGVILLAEQINAPFHSLDELRTRSTVPVLQSIPLIVTPEDTVRRQRRLRMAAASVTVALFMIVGASYFIAHGNERLVTLVTSSKGRM
jgi:polysaccharide chain length determinant protein (PEP-CTERM system associated)